jgi:prepilin-type N-terminal cleavage/methylation domain-containing protein
VNTGSADRRTSTDGFTLLEMVIVISLIALVASIAIPNMVGKMPKIRLRGAAGAMASELRAARMLARSAGRPVTVVLNSSKPSLTVQTDKNGNGTFEDDETSRLDLSSYTGIAVSSSVSNGVFDTRGMFICGDGRWKITCSTDSGLEEYVYVFAGGFMEQSVDSL